MGYFLWRGSSRTKQHSASVLCFIRPGFGTLRTSSPQQIFCGFLFTLFGADPDEENQDAGPSGGDEYVAPHHEAPGSYRSSQGSERKLGTDAQLLLPDTNAGERQTGRRAQLSNISAAKM